MPMVPPSQDAPPLLDSLECPKCKRAWSWRTPGLWVSTEIEWIDAKPVMVMALAARVELPRRRRFTHRFSCRHIVEMVV